MIWPYPEPITLLRTATGPPDSYGNDTVTETEQLVEGCAVWPSDSNASGSNENVQAADMVITGYALLAPPGTGITAADRVRLADGRTYEVVGTPGTWRSPLTNRQPGEQVSLRLVTG